jgi:hypothetical protein
MTIPSYRQAAKLLGLTPQTLRGYVSTGKLAPGPWTVDQLEALRNRPDAPPRQRGSTAAHGTHRRYAAGCSCSECRAVTRAETAEREHAEGDKRFPAEQRAELLDLLRAGVLFPAAVAQLGLSPILVWGRCKWDAEWSAELTETLDQHRPADLPHGKQRGHVAGCRCSDCRASIR